MINNSAFLSGDSRTHSWYPSGIVVRKPCRTNVLVRAFCPTSQQSNSRGCKIDMRTCLGEALSAPEVSPCSKWYEVVFKLVLPFWAAEVDGSTSYVYPIIYNASDTTPGFIQPQNCIGRTNRAKHTILDECRWDMATRIGSLVNAPGTLTLIESGSARW